MDWAAFYFFAVFLSFRILQSSILQDFSYPSINYFANVIFLGALFSGALALFARGGGSVVRLGLYLSAGAFALILFLGAGADLYSRSLCYTLSAAALVVLFGGLLLDPFKRSLALRLFLALVAVVVAVGLLEYFVIRPEAVRMCSSSVAVGKFALGREVQLGEWVNKKDVYSTFVNPNILGSFLVVAAFVIVGVVASMGRGRSLLRKAVVVALLAAVVLTLLLTRSKGALVAALFGAGLFTILYYGKRRKRGVGKILAAYSVFCVLVFFAVLFLAAAREPQGGGAATSAAVRLEYWRPAGIMIGRSPLFGSGAGSYADQYTRYKNPVSEETKFAHNNYLQVLVEHGAVGLVALGAFFLILMRGLFREAPEAERETKPSARAGWLAAGTAGAGVLVMFISRMLGGIVCFPGGDLVFLVSLIVFSVAFLATGKGLERVDLSLFAAAAGGAFLFHSLFDFVLYSGGLFTSVVFLLVIARPSSEVSESGRVRSVGSRLAGLAAVSAGAAFVVFALLEALPALGAAPERYCGDVFYSDWYDTGRGAFAARALENYETVANKVPNDPKVLIRMTRLRAATAVDEGQFKRALEYAERAVALDPDGHAAWHALYEADRARLSRPGEPGEGVFARARESLKSAVARYPTLARYRMELGMLYELESRRADPRRAVVLRERALGEYRLALSYSAECRSVSARLSSGEREFLLERINSPALRSPRRSRPPGGG